MNKENLTKLATYLRSLPANYGHFNMSSFFSAAHGTLSQNSDDPDGDEVVEVLHTCGTTACAVGHGPSAGIPVIPSDLGIESIYDPDTFDHIGDKMVINWGRYTDRTLVNMMEGDDSNLWSFMFCGGWAQVEPTAAEAADRIEYVVQHDHAPESALWHDREWGGYSSEWRKTWEKPSI